MSIVKQQQFSSIKSNFFSSKKMRVFSFEKEIYKYLRHKFPILNLKLMAKIRATKMKHSLFKVLIQKG